MDMNKRYENFLRTWCWCILLLDFCDTFQNDNDRHVILIEGDILVDGWQVETQNSTYQNLQNGFSQKRQKRAVTSLTDKIWPNKTIPYFIGKNITDVVEKNIMKAMGHWEKHTCIRFVERSSEENYLTFGSGSCGCCSFVGMRGGEQMVTLSPRCAVYGVVLHELGHVIGFWHEHSRPDRDKFIKILGENVITEKLDNFERKTILEIDSLGQPYDYGSIMHYRKRTFSKNNKNTLETFALGVRVGQREKLSVGDIIQANLLYKCPKPDCVEELYAMEGNLSSPNYPVEYYKDHECTWIIHAMRDEMITLNFVQFQLEKSFNCTYDYLEIREGIDVTGHLIGRLCGEGKAGSVKSLSSLWIKFRSDMSVTGKGFLAKYIKSVNSDVSSGDGMAGSGEIADEAAGHFIFFTEDKPESPHAEYYAECNHYLTKMQGSVNTPLIPVGYTGKPVECSWTIEGGKNATRIHLSATVNRYMSLKAHCMGDIYQKQDKLFKRDDSKESNEVEPVKPRIQFKVERFQPVDYNCSESQEVLLTTQSVTIHWTAEMHMELGLKYIIDYDECRLGTHRCQHSCHNTVDSYTCSCYRGYMLDATKHYCRPKTAPFVDRCNSNLTTERGKLRAGTEPYEDCYFRIFPPDGSRIVLMFDKFNVPGNWSNGTCDGSFIEILGGSRMGEENVFCGTESPGPQIAARILILRVHADLYTQQYLPYFTAEYYVYPEQEQQDQQEDKCFHRLQPHEMLLSPGYPDLYPPHSMCVWRVSAKHQHTIVLIIDELDVEYTRDCAFDFVEVRDGRHRNSPLIAKYCGVRPPQPINSTGRHLWLSFVSDGTGSGKGFKGHFESHLIDIT